MRSGRGRRTADTVRGLRAGPAGRAGQGTEGTPATSGDDHPAQRAEPTGCGWFESSFHLREGAEVREHEVLDPIVNDLPLAWWIEWAGLPADARRP
jgi:hypothetical protein